MATIKITDAAGVDFDDFKLPDPAAVGAVVKTNTKTLWHIDYPGGSADDYTGTNLTYDPSKDLVSGTITGFKTTDTKVVQLQATGLTLDASVLINAKDGAAFLGEALKGNDTITGGAGNDHILGFAGNDTIDGGKGVDTMAGGDGDDIYVIDNALDQIVEGNTVGSGTDTVKIGLLNTGPYANVENYSFIGKGDWKFTANELDNTIAGGTGKDTIDGGLGNDVLAGGAGNDTLTGGAGNDTLDGGAGIDALTGGKGNDTYVVDNLKDTVTEQSGEGTKDTVLSTITLTLAANVENLTLAGKAAINGTGNGDANTLTGNDAANQLDGGGGADTLAGGKGNDVYTLTGGDDTVTETAGEGVDTVKSSDNVDLTAAKLAGAEIENIILLTGAVSATGNTLNNAILGNDADNTITGGAGNDTLTGGKGNDTYVMSAGTDKIVEAAGVAGGIDTLKSDVAASLAPFANVENLTLTGNASVSGTGNTLANVLTGNSGDNTLDGGAGNDTLIGGGGTDILKGGAGNDTYLYDSSTITIDEGTAKDTGDTVQSSIFDLDLGAIGGGKIENATLLGTSDLDATGTTGINVLTGNDGANRLDGGAGADTLIGGKGDDTYIVDNLKDVVKEFASQGHDTVLTTLSTVTAADNVEDYSFTGTGNWNFKGNAGNNLVTGGAGNDTIDGGAGDDTVVFNGQSTDFQIVYSQGKAYLTDLNAADGNEGVDNLVNVEHVQFSDKTIGLSAQTVLKGSAANEQAGHAIAAAGDINADGFADFIIGAPGGKGGAGVAYVVYGDMNGLPASLDLSALKGATGFKISGAAGGDAAGYSVASAGDINKDGFDDIIVGAMRADAHGKDSGAAYVIFGKESGIPANIDLGKLNGTDGFKLSGGAANDLAGGAVAGAGDINGDGYADIIIGADSSDENGTNAGTSYIVFGHGGAFDANLDLLNMSGTKGFALQGVLNFDHLGWSVAGAGDFNGDGIDDLIVGGVAAGSPGNYSGAAYVLFGETNGFGFSLNLDGLDGTKGFRLVGGSDGDGAGFSVASAGDINGDGFADLIVGAPYVDGAGESSGTAYVVFGHDGYIPDTLPLIGLDGKNGFKIEGLKGGDYAGLSVSSAGDVNGDGFDDILIGAPNAGANGTGAAYVLFGTDQGFAASIDLANLDPSQGFVVTGDKAGDAAGIAVSAAGDIDGDGYDDLLVGAAFADPHGASSGTVTVIYGGGATYFSQFTGTAKDDTLTGTTDADIIRGLGGNDSLTGLDGADRLDGGDGNDTLVGGAGNDILIAGDGADTMQGGADDDIFVISKGNLGFKEISGGNGSDTLRTTGGPFEIDLADFAGKTIKDVEKIDLTHSGVDRLNLTAAAVHDLSSSSDTVIIDGTKFDTVSLSLDFQFDGQQKISGEIYNRFTAGSDVVIIRDDVSIATGITLGDPDVPGFTLTSGEAKSEVGFSVNGVGDVNGDGYDDVIIGARYSTQQEGAAYVVFGTAAGTTGLVDLENLDPSEGFKLSGAHFNYNIGSSVSTAGDFNGDGIDDILIGASRGGSATGAPGTYARHPGDAYIVYGHTGTQTDVDFTNLSPSQGFRVEGMSAYGALGFSVSSAGDVNGDGYDDVIMSALLDSQGGKYAGAAYVLFGHAGTSANFTTDDIGGAKGFQLIGAAANQLTGYSVSGGGDTNGDGYDDLIVTTAANSAKAYVIYGHAGAFDDKIYLGKLDSTQGYVIDQVRGSASASLGDVNGDGYDDFIFGNFAAEPNGSRSGAAYVVFGHATGTASITSVDELDGSNGFLLAGNVWGNEISGDNAGRSVAAAGDFNGDGYADILIGAREASQNGHGSGGAYLIFGSPDGFDPVVDLYDATLDVTKGIRISGAGAADYAGFSVNAAGDLNGDGFDDLVVGAPYADDHAGISYVIYGGDYRAEVTHVGTSKGETITGDGTAEIFASGQGDDVLNGKGGADVFQAGAGNDQIHVDDNTFFRVDGGLGTDTLHLDYSGAIDFGNLDGKSATVDRGKIAGIEIIDVANGKANALTFHLADLLDIDVGNTDVGGKAALDNVLKIDGEAGDTLTLSKADGWGTTPDTTTLAGYKIYTVNLVRIAVDTDIGVSLV